MTPSQPVNASFKPYSNRPNTPNFITLSELSAGISSRGGLLFDPTPERILASLKLEDLSAVVFKLF